MMLKAVKPRTLAIVAATLTVVGILAIVALWKIYGGGVGLKGFPAGSTETVAYSGRFPAQGDVALKGPMGIVYAGGRIYVAESKAGRIAVFRPSGVRLDDITVPPLEGATTCYPIDIAVVGNTTLAVVDTAGRRVVVVSTRAKPGHAVSLTVGSRDKTTAPVQPNAVACGDGELFVADGDDHTIKVYRAVNGTYLRTIGASLKPALTYVGGMCLDNGRLYVSDSNAGRVVVLDSQTGAVKEVFPDRLSLPRGIAVGGTGDILLADTFAQTVYVDGVDGISRARITASTSAELPLTSPRDVAWVDSAGRAYITDAQTGVIDVFNVRARSGR